jgi:acetyltransferase-like isoleucine patch superfamily enzyme
MKELLKQWLKKVLRRGPRFSSPEVTIGRGVSFGRGVQINAKKVIIGDGCQIGNNVIINADIFTIGDLGTVYDNCFFPGPGEIHIGHNFWLGTGSIIDGHGGTRIGDNVDIGAGSQLWGHMKFGDTLAGCRFHSAKSMIIGNDVWLVGHNLVSPVTIGNRVLVMLGSLVTRDLNEDHTYAGSPAKDVTDRFGSQFDARPLPDRINDLQQRIREFTDVHGCESEFGIIGVDPPDSRRTWFNIQTRHYTKRGTDLERALMLHLLPEAKFTPEPYNNI